MLLKNIQADGTSRRFGVLLVDGAYHEVTDLDVWTDWSDDKDPAAARLGVRTAAGPAVIEARTITLAPLRNRRRTDDGQVLVSRVAEAWPASGADLTFASRLGAARAQRISTPKLR